MEAIVRWLEGIPKEWVVVIVGALPVSELRGAIPLALGMGMSSQKAFLLAVIGNLLPVIPLLVGFKPVSDALLRFKQWQRFINWLYHRTQHKAEIVQRYEALGLLLFVAVPLPMTGAWTGCIAASIFRIPFRYAFPAIVGGVVSAGFIVLGTFLVGKEGFQRFPLITAGAIIIIFVVLAGYGILKRRRNTNNSGMINKS